MNSRFAFPVSIALALHAGLFFGFPRTHYTPEGKPAPIKTKDYPPIVMPPVIELVEVIRDVAPAPIGSPDVRPEPVRDDQPLPPDVFTIPTRPALPTDDLRKRVSWETPGDPKGTIDVGSIVSMTALDNQPRTRLQYSPDYPFAAKQAGLTGEVMVQFVVDSSGGVHDPIVVRSTDRIFDAPSLRAVLKWRFVPGKHNGQPVSFRMIVPVVFTLSGE